MLDNLIYNVIPLILVWLAGILIVWLISSVFIRTRRDLGVKSRSAARVLRIMRLIRIYFTVLMAIIVMLVIFFLSNPREKKYRSYIPEAQVDETISLPSKEDIDATNKSMSERRSVEKKKEAEKDNDAAMERAEDLFSKY